MFLASTAGLVDASMIEVVLLAEKDGQITATIVFLAAVPTETIALASAAFNGLVDTGAVYITATVAGVASTEQLGDHASTAEAVVKDLFPDYVAPKNTTHDLTTLGIIGALPNCEYMVALGGGTYVNRTRPTVPELQGVVDSVNAFCSAAGVCLASVTLYLVNICTTIQTIGRTTEVKVCASPQ